MFGAIAGGIASALAGGAMSKLFGGGQKAASGGIQGDVLATDNNTVGMGDAGIKSAIQGSNVPNPDEAVPSFVSGAMAKAGKGLLEGTLQAGTSAVSDKLLGLVGLGGKSAADKGKDTRDYLAAAFPELNAWERAGADASSAGMVDAGFENQKELTKMQLDNQKEIDRKSGSAGMPRPISYAVFCCHHTDLSSFPTRRSSDLLVGLGGKSAADKGKDTRDYLAAAFPELNAWERAGADASSAGMVDAGFENQKELTKMQLDNQKE